MLDELQQFFTYLAGLVVASLFLEALRAAIWAGVFVAVLRLSGVLGRRKAPRRTKYPWDR